MVSEIDTTPDAAPVLVKALNWDKHPDDDEYYAPVFDGETGELNCYLISQDSTGLEWLVYLRNDVMDGYHPTLEAAKAAAQQDYEARILAALEPAPALMAELVEAANGVISADGSSYATRDAMNRLAAVLAKVGGRANG